MQYDNDFVLKVNEIYHDIEAEEYETKHPEIFIEEVSRWQRFAKMYFLERKDSVRLLDVGSGTGFVPRQLGRYLREGDLIVCSDISMNILEVCKKYVEKENFKCSFEFIKTCGLNYDLHSGQFDFITMNSVLHHIPNLLELFKEIDRMLKVGGRVVIGHEGNPSFFKNKILYSNWRIQLILENPKRALHRLTRMLKLDGFLCMKEAYAKEKQASDHVFEQVNKKLMLENIILQPLTVHQMAEIIDWHSQTAGGFHKEKGISPEMIVREYLNNYEIESYETYDHILKNVKSGLIRIYETFLCTAFPRSGAHYFVVLRKIA